MIQTDEFKNRRKQLTIKKIKVEIQDDMNQLHPDISKIKRFVSVPKVIIQSEKISGSAKWLYVVMKSFCHGKENHKVAFPSIKKLSEYSGFCKNTIIKLTKELVEVKAIGVGKFRIRSKYYNIYYIPSLSDNKDELLTKFADVVMKIKRHYGISYEKETSPVG